MFRGVTAPPSPAAAPTPSGADDWESHWTSYAEAAALNPAQTYRRKLVFELLALAAAPPPARIFEVGSGQGDFARDLLGECPSAELLGVDLSATGVAIAQRKLPSGAFFQRDLTRPADLPEKFRGWATHAVCSEVLEHVDDPAGMLRNLKPYLAPGCRLVVTVPGGPMSAFDRHIGHRRHFTPELLGGVLRDGGFDVELIRGAGFPFFNLYRLVVVARGRALIKDVSASEHAELQRAARLAMRAFDWLFRLNSAATQRGWQLVARAIPRE